MRRFNLSEWALANRPLVLYMMLVLAIIGVWSYRSLGQSEDPPFTFKAMVVRTVWPGATAEEVAREVTDRIEKKLLETGSYERITSYSRPGESQVIFIARDSMKSAELPALWYEVRKKIGDIRHTLPQGAVGPFFNDEFGDTFGNIYALTGKGFDYALKKDYAERIELQLQRVPDVAKIELVGLQDEKVWIELSNTKLATLGIPLSAVQQALAEQNAVTPAGFFETPTDRVQLRVTGAFKSVDDIRAFPIRAGDRTVRLGDIATVERGFADPAAPRMRFMGEDAIGIAVSMKPGGDILKLGQALDAETVRLEKTLPLGLELHRVADQPAAVRDSVGEFVRVLAEAVIIVLLVSFFSLGLRTGLVVAVSIPLVLAMTFAVMHYFGIGLHKISLGALVLALGLLVDDAIIAVEMMAIKMEQGYSRLRAAAFAYETTAFPMLTGTLVTAAGFLPIATAASSTGEYTRSLFQVVTIALIVSWVAAVLFIPYLGEKMLPEPNALPKPGSLEGRLRAFRERMADRWPQYAGVLAPPAAGGHGHDAVHDPYRSGFYQRFRSMVRWCIGHRWVVIFATVAAFVVSIALFRFIPQQFFPESTRLELMVDLELAEGSSLKATDAAAKRFEAMLADRKEVENYVAYVGTGSPRFYLPLDQQLPQKHFTQFVVRSRDIEARETLRAWLMHDVRARFPELQLRVTRLENGPPVGYPVQFRVSGEHIERVRELAYQVMAEVRENPNVINVNVDWDEPSKVVRLIVDQERARALGVSTQHLASFLSSALSGLPVSTYREDNELIDILLRGPEDERVRLDLLGSLAVPTASGKSVPVMQVARLESVFEEGVVWHRNRLPTVTVRADIATDQTAPTVIGQIEPKLAEIRASLPDGYLLQVGGTVEDSARGQNSIKAGMPLFLLVVVTLLMLQLRSLPRVLLVLSTAPLGLIGVVLFLLVFRVPFGFIAMLGVIALSGMIMRNSIILIDQIEQDIASGHDRWTAIIESTVRRFRPIVLTALAAILAMIPLSRSVFFGPMAVAIMGGLIVATALTLLFLPALYAAWFRVRAEEARAPR
ncbi:efflux RND transporter permease subunit [Lysobacter brunescens]|uniref:Efflux RND transporter permease subunit n=1 Tax=Lysobacter brunescens TaxID=262323 RepID=A0ABW2YIV2_9GAMM